MSPKTVAKSTLLISFFAISAIEFHHAITQTAYGDSPLTAPLTSPVITTPSGSNNNANSGSNNSNSGSSGSTPYSCSSTKPLSAPVLLQAVQTGKSKVTLFWKKSDGPATGYIVSFGPQSDANTYATGVIGNIEMTTYTINDLGENQTYFFKVLAVNDCAPSDYSNVLKINLNSRQFRTSFMSYKLPVHNSASYQAPQQPVQPVDHQTNPVSINTNTPHSLFELITHFFLGLFGK